MKAFQSVNRVEALSDAVFAFAATLLVVSLEVPKNFDLLVGQLKGFFSFGISFFALILIWSAHYNYFRRTTYLDNWVIALNMILLFTILYFVYPLKFLANLMVSSGGMTADKLSLLFQLYGLGFSVLFACISLMYWRPAQKNKALENRSQLFFFARHFGIFVLVGILSMLLSRTQFGLRFGMPGFIYALLGPLCYLHGKFFGYDKPVTATQQPD